MKIFLKYWLFALFLIAAFSQKSSAQITLLDPKLDGTTIVTAHSNGASALTHIFVVITKQLFNSGLDACKRDTTSFIKRGKINN